ncbi:transposable element Tcb1 transposase [Trichonephila clavipes]|nr:transposable element Tcb1 transposase [Trichonephila clavipes]
MSEVDLTEDSYYELLSPLTYNNFKKEKTSYNMSEVGLTEDSYYELLSPLTRMIRWALKLAEFHVEWEHRLEVQNVVVDIFSRNPVESIVGENIACAVIRDLVLSSREQLISEQKNDPELGHIYRYLENPDDSSINATVCGNWSHDSKLIDGWLFYAKYATTLRELRVYIFRYHCRVSTTDRRGRSHPPQCTTSLSARTIRRRLQQSGLSARRPLLGLPLTQNHRRIHRRWCHERRMWVAEWNEVVFTEESRICRQHHDGRIRLWRHRGERRLNICIMHCPTGPAPGIMVWGGIGYHSHTPLVCIAGTLNSQRYISEKNFKRHKKNVNGTDENRCNHCNKNFARSDSLQRHLKLHEVSRAKILENKRRRLHFSPQPGPSRYQAPAAEDRRDNTKSRTCLNTFQTNTISTDLNFIKNLNGFLQNSKEKVIRIVENKSKEKKGINWYVCAKVRFVRKTAETEEEKCESHFRSICEISLLNDSLEKKSNGSFFKNIIIM